MRVRAIILAAIMVLSAFLVYLGGISASPTVDETHYVGLGSYLVQEGDWRLKGAILHPPLSYYLNSLLLSGIEIPEEVWNAPDQDSRGRALYRLGNGDRIVLLTRLPFMALVPVLVLLVFFEAKRRFGTTAAFGAALLMALEPNVLAHGGLATPDLLLTVTFFWVLVRVRIWHENRGWRNLIWAGLALGLAFLSKFTAILLLGIIPVAALLAGFRVRQQLAGYGLIVLIAFGALHLGYLPHYTHPMGAAALGAGTEEPHRESVSPFWKGVLPRPFGKGIEFQRNANAGHRAFFRGEVTDGGWKLYYPVAFLAKTAIPFLLLAGLGIVLLFVGRRERHRGKRDGGAGSRKRRKKNIAWLLIPPILLALFFIFMSRINIGLRYLLPVYPFLAIAGGRALAWLIARRGIGTIAASLLIAWQAAGTARACPHFIPYFNEAVGGSEGGMELLGDSNLDWGQGLPALAKWIDENELEGVYLAYFGNADPTRYGIKFRFLPGWLFAPSREVRRESLGYHPDPEFVAIGRSVLQGFWLPDPDLYDWIREYPRVAVLAGAIEVYDIGGNPEAHDKLAWIYRRAGKLDYVQDELLIGLEESKRLNAGDDR